MKKNTARKPGQFEASNNAVPQKPVNGRGRPVDRRAMMLDVAGLDYDRSVLNARESHLVEKMCKVSLHDYAWVCHNMKPLCTMELWQKFEEMFKNYKK